MSLIKLTPRFVQELAAALPLLQSDGVIPKIRPAHLREASQADRDRAAELVRQGRADALIWPEDQ